MGQDKNLGLHNGGVDSKSGTDGEGAGFAGTIFALSYQIVVNAIHCICYHWDGDTLNVTRFDKA